MHAYVSGIERLVQLMSHVEVLVPDRVVQGPAHAIDHVHWIRSDHHFEYVCLYVRVRVSNTIGSRFPSQRLCAQSIF